MKIYSLIYLLIISLLVTGCNLPPTKPIPPAVPSTAVTCVSKLDRTLDFTYEPAKAVKWESDDYKVSVYLINTTSGNQIILNSLELENYNCN